MLRLSDGLLIGGAWYWVTHLPWWVLVLLILVLLVVGGTAADRFEHRRR